MASGSFTFGASGYLQGKIDWSSSSNGSNANSSNVTANLYARRTNNYTTTGRSWSGYVKIGSAQTNINFSSSVSVGESWVLMATVSTTIGHNSNGTGSATVAGSITGPSGTALSGNTTSGSQTVTLDTIPRYASVTHSLNSTGLNQIKINWSSDSTCDLVQYSLNNGGWINTSGNPYTISGLNPNTIYKVKTRVRRKDSQLLKYHLQQHKAILTVHPGLVLIQNLFQSLLLLFQDKHNILKHIFLCYSLDKSFFL